MPPASGGPAAGRRGAAVEQGNGQVCKTLDVSRQSLPRESTTHHSSHGGELGEWADPVQDAIFTCAGGAGASVLDRIEAASPILCAVR
jgi:hypothetical protein